MKIYIGIKIAPGDDVIWVVNTDPFKHPYRLHHVKKHSPTGMSWGYLGSGCADTALSILTDFFGDNRAIARPLYQAFKEEFIGPAGEQLSIPDVLIHKWLRLQHPSFYRREFQDEKE